ncbi:DUF5682 family protein [Pontibacter chinhatensis]|uniref:Uncharacterized protein n=1 Tax=Pontibacter chinhatensis TaxID=1436961 RepID=A0A1I2Z3M9_9BACT|nr:DUF5682 family protein [Pontibacter chinhatensis]SFH32463.1 hypothetical protein SAMN05421739_11150 [Pontibacter chinhatensis]
MVHLLGIRHHGPGSARNVVQALEQLQPDIILIEGPPEGEALLRWAHDPEMAPPVALLAYMPDSPQQAAFYPFATYSPEWQAIQYALAKGLPVRFIDMPLTHKFALQQTETEETPENQDPEIQAIHRNPLRFLAEAAGYTDAELWWEQQFELRYHALDTFQAVAEAMQALRDSLPEQEDRLEQVREAFMRKGIRTAQKEQYARIAVICGAWHVPALQHMPKQKADDELTRKLPKVKVEATWIPWTNSRLSFESGYGAGINSPGWYEHLWQKPDDDGTHWLIHVARVFRAHQLDISSAHVIETVRLAQTLTALRGQAKAGLQELNEAVRTVMCMGDEAQLQLIWRELIVGHSVGSIPAASPQVPLQRDLELWQKKLRLKPQEGTRLLQLDLREEPGLQKSILLHRLRLLGVHWGEKKAVSGKGTFKEEWELNWQPELSIHLLEKAAWGNTLEEAATAYVTHLAGQARQLREITFLLGDAIPAELPLGVAALMRRMDELAASTSDVTELMQAFLPLVQIKRYGHVRNIKSDTLTLIMDSLVARICAGLPAACSAIDEETGESIAGLIVRLEQGILLLEEEEYKDVWYATLLELLDTHQANALVCGTCCKILQEAGVLQEEQTAQEFSRALSPGTDPAYASSWLEGFLKNSATTLILDDRIWSILDAWLAELPGELFQQVAPILRRTFADYTASEKRKLAEKAKAGGAPVAVAATELNLDEERAREVLPVFYKIIGVA